MHGRLTAERYGGAAGSGLSAMRIGVVLHDFALGGTERVAIRLADRWAHEGAAVTLFAGSTAGELGPLIGPRVAIATPARPIERGPGSVSRVGIAAAAHFRAQPIDICFVPGNYHWPVAAIMARLDSAVRPAIAVQISAALRKPQRGRWRQTGYDARMRHLLRGADAIVALCMSAADEADAILGRSDAVAIPLPALGARSDPPRLPHSRAILAAGRLVPEKGFDTLIDAFALLAADDRDIALTILGEGPERPTLERRIADHGLSTRIELPGYVADIRPWLDRARLFVLSSRFEGYGAVLIEALAAGRPVVATACTPAIDDLLGAPGAGRAVAIDDPVAMAAAIAATLAAPAPAPETLAALVGHHRIDDVARRYGHVFAQMLAARRCRPASLNPMLQAA